jgi:hypothetical protein
MGGRGPLIAWGWLGLVVLATGLFSFCGAYALLGMNTCPVQSDSQPR